jgi:hypothetical protein
LEKRNSLGDDLVIVAEPLSGGLDSVWGDYVRRHREIGSRQVSPLVKPPE